MIIIVAECHSYALNNLSGVSINLSLNSINIDLNSGNIQEPTYNGQYVKMYTCLHVRLHKDLLGPFAYPEYRMGALNLNKHMMFSIGVILNSDNYPPQSILAHQVSLQEYRQGTDHTVDLGLVIEEQVLIRTCEYSCLFS